MAKKKYRIQYSELFNNDIEKVFLYIVNELKNSIAAQNLIKQIDKEIKNRSENPESFKCFKLRSDIKWYRINVNNYSIFYTVDGNVMTMRRFLYSKRNFDKLI